MEGQKRHGTEHQEAQRTAWRSAQGTQGKCFRCTNHVDSSSSQLSNVFPASASGRTPLATKTSLSLETFLGKSCGRPQFSSATFQKVKKYKSLRNRFSAAAARVFGTSVSLRRHSRFNPVGLWLIRGCMQGIRQRDNVNQTRHVIQYTHQRVQGPTITPFDTS